MNFSMAPKQTLIKRHGFGVWGLGVFVDLGCGISDFEVGRFRVLGIWGECLRIFVLQDSMDVVSS